MTRYTKYNPETGEIEFTFGGKGGDLEANEPYIVCEFNGNEYIVVNGEPVRKPDSEIDAFHIGRAWVELKNRRNGSLLDSDWTQGADSPLTDLQKSAWATYRQQLRDLPDNTIDPRTPEWPIPPN